MASTSPRRYELPTCEKKSWFDDEVEIPFITTGLTSAAVSGKSGSCPRFIKALLAL
mgnify:CR=1 FL=1